MRGEPACRPGSVTRTSLTWYYSPACRLTRQYASDCFPPVPACSRPARLLLLRHRRKRIALILAASGRAARWPVPAGCGYRPACGLSPDSPVPLIWRGRSGCYATRPGKTRVTAAVRLETPSRS